MPLPEIEEKLQRKTADKVRESFALRRKSEQLFERARQAVEMAVEYGEAAAINWLEAE